MVTADFFEELFRAAGGLSLLACAILCVFGIRRNQVRRKNRQEQVIVSRLLRSGEASQEAARRQPAGDRRAKRIFVIAASSPYLH